MNSPASRPNAIVVGATSGIGRSLALLFSKEGYRVGITGRRTALLEEVAAEMPGEVFVQSMDVTRGESVDELEALIARMGGLDLFVYNSGVGYQNPELNLSRELETVATNVEGFTRLVNVAFRRFVAQGRGHLVGISSIAANRGNRRAPAYFASKAYLSHYLQGLRQKCVHEKLPITVTDIQPGYVDTPMIDARKAFWVVGVEVAARQIAAAIRDKKSHAYVPRRWRLIAWLQKTVPDSLYNRFG